MNDESGIYRILDANLNRLREGIRVLEDLFRYLHDDEAFASKLKDLRHLCRIDPYEKLLSNRDIVNDCLRETTQSESQREGVKVLMVSNFKRAQEAARVLEETVKLLDSSEAEKFKQVRYELYDLEKQAAVKV